MGPLSTNKQNSFPNSFLARMPSETGEEERKCVEDSDAYLSMYSWCHQCTIPLVVGSSN